MNMFGKLGEGGLSQNYQKMEDEWSCTVKSVLSGHSKLDKGLNANGSLMKVLSIAECSPRSILQYF